MESARPNLCQAISHWRRPFAGAILVMLFAGVFATVYQDRSYVGKTTFQVYQLSGSADLLSLLHSPQIVTEAAKRKKLPEHWNLTETEIASKLRRIVEISVEKGSDVASVEVYGDDPVEAANLANAVRDSFEERLRSAESERITKGLMALDNKVKILEKEVEISGKELGEAESALMSSADMREVSSEASTANFNRLKTEHANQLQVLEELKNSAVIAHNSDYLPRHPMDIRQLAKPGTIRVWRIPPGPHLVGIGAAAVAAVLLLRKGAKADGRKDEPVLRPSGGG